MPVEQALTATNDLWATAPWTPFYLEAGEPDKWPDPWTLLSENYYCDLAKALGIVYTIQLSGHSVLAPEIRVYKDTEKNYFYNLAWFAQGKYILNMQDQSIVNNAQIEKTLELKFRYTDKELNIEL
jgi:hypothetical protein